ncbi:uncharacterized protein TNCV_3011981 [Trichonephila clavipes]|nr:uncharacterized protein TNCV_3011981 [Trichonephila clavipes]
MSEKALVDRIFVRLEPQVQYYVEARNPQTAIQLLEVLAKFEERYSCKATLGVTIKTTVKEISGSRAGIGFKTMIADLTIGDIKLEIEDKMTILVERTKEIGVRVNILVEAVENKWDD